MACLLAFGLLATTPALGAPSTAKAIWGPVQRGGHSLFPLYRRLGAGIFQMELRWDSVARSEPRAARDPADRAYVWPPEIDYAIREASANGLEVALQVRGTPRWANSRRPEQFAPARVGDFGDFIAAAARRYPAVRRWIVWGEPSKRSNFRVLGVPWGGRAYEEKTPRAYARLLDAAFAALKSADSGNLVVGGNTYTVGDIPTRTFVANMRLPSGRPPRLDAYGHNAFTLRPPNLADPPLSRRVVDFSDLDSLGDLIDSNLGRRHGKPIPIYIPEFTLPTDHANWEFNFWVSRRVQAQWLTKALAIVRRSPRILTLGWLSLYDDPPRRHHDEVNRGLIDDAGNLKPAFRAYARG